MVDPSRDMETEETGLNLFDEKATAAGSFPTSMLGYDRHAVDTYVREVEHQVSDLKQRTRALQREMAYIRAEVGETDFERLGAHATSMLKAAEGQAKDIVERAEQEAQRIVTEARRLASSLRESAQQEADDIRLTGLGSLRQLRTEQANAGQAALDKARADARQIVEEATAQSTAIIDAARSEAESLVAAGHIEAQRVRSAGERDASAIREAAHKDAERALAEASTIANDAAAAVAERLRLSQEEATRAADAVAAARQEALTIHQSALEQVEELRVGAHREAEAIMTNARNKAAEVLTQLEERVGWRKEQLHREVSMLEGRKRSALAQLANLRALAEQSDAQFRDDEETTTVVDVQPPEVQPRTVDELSPPPAVEEPAQGSDTDAGARPPR